jgi:alpha-glucosidase
MDVIHGIVKREDLIDLPEDRHHSPDRFDEPTVHAHLREIRKLLDNYPGDRTSVGEVYILSTARVAEYYGDGDELHMAFNFPPLYAPWDAPAWRKRIDRVVEELDRRDAWPTWVLSNHDNPRHRTRYGSEARARAAAVLLLTLRGTPFMYAGEELGLEDAVIAQDRVVDPGGRDGCRAPIPWTPASDHGWGVDDAWLPWPPEPTERNAELLRADETSILHLYRRILAARRRSPALQLGSWSPLPAPPSVLAYTRLHGDDRRIVIVNFGDAPVTVPVETAAVVEVSSTGAGEGEAYRGTVAADMALILR